MIRPGELVSLLATGTIVPLALAAADELGRRGVRAEVVSFHTVKPLDQECLRQRFRDCRVVATVEEHSVVGGLGGAVAEWLVDHAPQRARLVRFGTPDAFFHETGDQEHARASVGLTAADISTASVRALEG